MQPLAIGVDGVVGDRADERPAQGAVEALSRAAGARVEGQERETPFTRDAFDGLHELAAQTPSLCSTMDDHFAHLGPVRLVGSPRGLELDRGDDLTRSRTLVWIARDEDRTFGVEAGEGRPPPGFGLGERERLEKTHGRTGVDRVNQQRREGLEITLFAGGGQNFDGSVLHGEVK